MNPAIQERLETARHLLGSYDILSEKTAQAESAWLITILVHGRSEERYIQQARRDVRDDAPSGVREWLTGLPIGPAEPIIVLWSDSRSGIRATYGGVVAAYDELWYPSSDDVWIRATSGDWLLELCHEEVFRFFKRERV
ncbi:hypothetical protein [Archangium sp.]|uniref:hypothetical protein n=1 Tax=Archangium sp. TaxID=1872627 RepID=UPI002D5D03CF|nr:hypothetical protein [Archangium sp.]HYO54672.1 hypothetical protein [Archangium sp.]